jgi:hypothetical protein
MPHESFMHSLLRMAVTRDASWRGASSSFSAGFLLGNSLSTVPA